LAGTWNTNKGNVLLDGYYVVAYRTMDEAVKGTARSAATFEGGTFYFANAEHLSAFKKDPR
jgi:hypothetical protein